MKVMIYSNEHSLWWKPNYCGYTDSQDKAGIFDYDKAVKKYPNIGFNTYHTEDFFVKVEVYGITDEVISENSQSNGLFADIECPYCGAKHFIIGGGTATSMYCPTIIKDGKVVSKDHNIYTQEYTCLECGKTFKSVNGKIEK